MATWIVKGKPTRNDLHQMLVRGKIETWRTRRPPTTLHAGDMVLLWKSSPDLCVVGVGEVASLAPRDHDGVTHFDLRYLSEPFESLVGIAQLRDDEVVGVASFLKPGPAGTVFPLTDEQARRIAERVLAANPRLCRDERAALLRLVIGMRLPGAIGVPDHAILIRDPYITWILEGRKTWEIRGAATNIRGPIGLIKSKTSRVFGVCELVDVVGPLSLTDLRAHAAKLNMAAAELKELPYAKTYAWVVRNATPFPEPIRYAHPSGAVIWVKLSMPVRARIRRRLQGRTW